MDQLQDVLRMLQAEVFEKGPSWHQSNVLFSFEKQVLLRVAFSWDLSHLLLEAQGIRHMNRPIAIEQIASLERNGWVVGMPGDKEHTGNNWRLIPIHELDSVAEIILTTLERDYQVAALTEIAIQRVQNHSWEEKFGPKWQEQGHSGKEYAPAPYPIRDGTAGEAGLIECCLREEAEYRERLAQTVTGDRVGLGDLALSYFHAGDQVYRADCKSAIALYKDGLRITSALLSIDPDNVDCLHNESVSCDRLGDLHNDANTARTWYQRGLNAAECSQELIPSNLSYKYQCSIFYLRLGALELEKDRALAERWCRKGLAVTSDILKDPQASLRTEALKHKVSYCGHLAYLAKRSDFEEAKDWHERAVAATDQLPEHQDNLYPKFLAKSRFGIFLKPSMHSKLLLLDALTIAKQLLKVDSEDRVHLGYLSYAFTNLGSWALGNDLQKAKYWYREAFFLDEKLQDRNDASSMDGFAAGAIHLAYVHRKLGETKRASILGKSASSAISEALILDPERYQSHYTMATVCAHSGRLEEGVCALREAFRLGLGDVDEVRTNPFVARLRTHTDFDALFSTTTPPAAQRSSMDVDDSRAQFAPSRASQDQSNPTSDNRKMETTLVEVEVQWAEMFTSNEAEVLLYIEKHGTISKTEVSVLMGGPRQLRKFSRSIDKYNEVAPFKIELESSSGVGVYLRRDK